MLAGQTASAPTIGALAWRDLNQAVLAPLSTILGRTSEIAPGQAVDEVWIQARDGEEVELQITITDENFAEYTWTEP